MNNFIFRLICCIFYIIMGEMNSKKLQYIIDTFIEIDTFIDTFIEEEKIEENENYLWTEKDKF